MRVVTGKTKVPVSRIVEIGEHAQAFIAWNEDRELPKSRGGSLVGPPNHSMPGGLTTIIDCLQPLLFQITEFLLASPSDLKQISSVSASFSKQLEPQVNSFWESLYIMRWLVFYDALTFQGVCSWRAMYMQTVAGACGCLLEVFDREKRIGFAMSAMPAWVRYDRDLNCYVATYISANKVLPEAIPLVEQHRFRFCPASARQKLRPGYQSCGPGRSPEDILNKPNVPQICYPYKVLEGLNGLQVGQPLELQWKMQAKSPFGWWYGVLEELRLEADGAMATLIFPHFPANSRWHRLGVRLGGSEIQPCAFGGYTGGVRAVSPEENRHWLRFFRHVHR